MNPDSAPLVQLGTLLPPGVVVAAQVGLAPAGEPAGWSPMNCGRASEFAAGRWCAMRAAARLGVGGCVIGTHADGRPAWPPSLTGSITHTRGFAAAAVGARRNFRAIGIDIEWRSGVSRDLWSHVLLAEEAEWIAGLRAETQADMATLLFSAKETFYKCRYEVLKEWLDFTDLRVDGTGEYRTAGCVAVRAVRSRRSEWRDRPLSVRFALAGRLVLTAASIPAS
jgi:enterobactin synthetase component D